MKKKKKKTRWINGKQTTYSSSESVTTANVEHLWWWEKVHRSAFFPCQHVYTIGGHEGCGIDGETAI